ncbi:hypothetical protein A0H81_03617 [Grifola frondosa]|uniref:Uncharacterized protein n=1 Tax=Grifola frondosa TaxID=5627 RepID=A0A1C7MJ98_GRIFR|nr:hypothetical protein A0H81_03617 [Grifola frondosa]
MPPPPPPPRDRERDRPRDSRDRRSRSPVRRPISSRDRDRDDYRRGPPNSSPSPPPLRNRRPASRSPTPPPPRTRRRFSSRSPPRAIAAQAQSSRLHAATVGSRSRPRLMRHSAPTWVVRAGGRGRPRLVSGAIVLAPLRGLFRDPQFRTIEGNRAISKIRVPPLPSPRRACPAPSHSFCVYGFVDVC